MARELYGILGHSCNDFGEEFGAVIAVTVGENELHHIVAILIFTEAQELAVCELEHLIIKSYLFFMITTQSQPVLDESCDNLVGAAIIDSFLDDIQGQLGGGGAHTLWGRWRSVFLNFLI